jgi:hypothetical protein
LFISGFLVQSIYNTPLGIKISPGKIPREIAWQKCGGVAGAGWDFGPAVGGGFPLKIHRYYFHD